MDMLGVFSRWPRPLQSRRLLLALLLYRVALCFTLRTAESPDEWWQSEEVAYKMVFGRGKLTWEWDDAIRSHLFPTIFACPMLVLKWAGWDTAMTIWASSRCVQALIFFAHDCAMLALAQRLDDLWICRNIRKSGRGVLSSASTVSGRGSAERKSRAPTIASTTLAVLVVQWFLITTGVRSYSNVPESLFLLLSLYQTNFTVFLFWAGMSCAMRATAALSALPVFIVHVRDCCGKMGVARGLFFLVPLTVGMVAGVSSAICLVDYIFYKRLVFTTYNFVKFNCAMGVSKYFGVHTWYWYVFTLPAMAAPFVFFLAWMPVCWRRMQEVEKPHVSRSAPDVQGTLLSGCSSGSMRQEITRWAFVGGVAVMFYSTLDHKEMRFVYFLLALLLMISSVVVVVLCTGSFSERKQPTGVRRSCRWLAAPSAEKVRRLFTLSWGLSAVFGIVLLYGYRRGAPTLFHDIRGADWHFRHLEILTHCYVTPGLAQLHGKIDRLEFVDCPIKLDAVTRVPEVTQDRLFTEQTKAYALWRYLRVTSRLDVEDVDTKRDGKLSKNEWWREMHRLMPTGEVPALPDGIILFQKTAMLLETEFLRPMGYRRLAAVFHTPHSFEEHEDVYLELWAREAAQESTS